MREVIGFIVIVICIYFFGWWGLLSIILVMPIIGWKDRHKGPFPINQSVSGVSDYRQANNIAKRMPKSFRKMQDLLVKTSKESSSEDELIDMLVELRDNLREESLSDVGISDKKILTDFVDNFSKSFPNWRAEYIAVNFLIEKNY